MLLYAVDYFLKLEIACIFIIVECFLSHFWDKGEDSQFYIYNVTFSF